MVPTFEFGGAGTIAIEGNAYVDTERRTIIVPPGEAKQFSGLRLPAKLQGGRSDSKGNICNAGDSVPMAALGGWIIETIEEGVVWG